MSREQYKPPSFTDNNASSGGGGASGSAGGQQTGGFNLTGGAGAFDDGLATRPVKYLCGDCDSEVELRKGDAIRCKECGYRVLYKQRTNRMIQFEAR